MEPKSLWRIGCVAVGIAFNVHPHGSRMVTEIGAEPID
jgi:hypothetical protein